ncbi:LacI family DNA-binding transcriptional regulator [Tropicimonas marinistellae]|uniref:LacI family DNA-binding transcriptional regulator n=1 Tax=Tropicimonas marinistellae TaxID=1739787 RepID=UPI00082FA0BD|nr:LacI family DNA-binding transcriptional regulator [Tropicimonas marinistellae]
MSKKLRNMEEFSAATGLSRPTVSKYFNDPQSVRASTRAKIEQALERFDYRPSFLATNQNRRNPKTVGIVVPYFTDPFYAEIIRHIENSCRDAGHRTLVQSSHGDAETEIECIEMMRSLNIGGLILSPLGAASDAVLIRKLGREVPLLLFDSYVEGSFSFLSSDHVQGMRLITEYLCESGSPPCFIAMPKVNSTAAERLEGYNRAMCAKGQQPMVIENPYSDWNFERQGRDIARDRFAQGGFPSTTVLCASDRCAFGVIAAASERGLTVGASSESDLRVAGNDNYPISEFINPSLTTVAQDYEKLSQKAVEIILDRMEREVGAEFSGSQTRLPLRLIRRASA